jgi:hypothetical protein
MAESTLCSADIRMRYLLNHISSARQNGRVAFRTLTKEDNLAVEIRFAINGKNKLQVVDGQIVSNVAALLKKGLTVFSCSRNVKELSSPSSANNESGVSVANNK